jgi:hypothetical protein
MSRRRRATGRKWIPCVRIGARQQRRTEQRLAEAGGGSEMRRKQARRASRCGTFSHQISRSPPCAAITAQAAVGSDSVIPRRPLRGATSGLGIVTADGAAPRIGQPIARPPCSLGATLSRARPRMAGTVSSLAPIGQARVTASNPRRGTRAARDTRVRAIRARTIRAARAIHGLSGCRSPRRSYGSGQCPGANRGTVAAVMVAADTAVTVMAAAAACRARNRPLGTVAAVIAAVAGAVRREPNRLRDRVVAAVTAIAAEAEVAVAAAVRAEAAVGAARAVGAADNVTAAANRA